MRAAWAGLTVIFVAGCAQVPQHLAADGTYCDWVRSWRPPRTCTLESIPGDAAEIDAKEFGGAPDALTLYIVRNSLSDVSYRVEVSVDDRIVVATIPESFARLRLPPGEHRLSINWRTKASDVTISRTAGDVVFVDLGSNASTLWRERQFYLSVGDERAGRSRISDAKLVVDRAVVSESR